MANEWVLVDGNKNTYQTRSYTVVDGTGASFGTLGHSYSPRSASYAQLAGQPVAGVWAEEKTANNSVTRMEFYTGGIFDVRIAGTVTQGDWLVAASSQNYVKAWNPFTADGSFGLLTTASFAAVLGKAIDSGVDSDTINILLNV